MRRLTRLVALLVTLGACGSCGSTPAKDADPSPKAAAAAREDAPSDDRGQVVPPVDLDALIDRVAGEERLIRLFDVVPIRAGASISGLAPFTFPPGQKDRQVSSCALELQGEVTDDGVLPHRGVFSGEFGPANLAHGPRLSITDDGTGSIIGGLLVDDAEWELTQRGKMTIVATQFTGVRLVKDEAGRWLAEKASVSSRDADGVVMVVEATWTGPATDNFTSDTGTVSVNIQCALATRKVVKALGWDVVQQVMPDAISEVLECKLCAIWPVWPPPPY